MSDEMFDEHTRKYMRALAEEDDEPSAAHSRPRFELEEADVEDEDGDGITRQMDAPLKAPSVKLAKEFFRKHPEARVKILFPTVYEEDRSAKIRDLGTAQTLRAISHRSMSEMMAQEFGLAEYNYDQEQEAIDQEQPAIAMPEPRKPEEVNPEDRVHRGDLAAAEQAKFRARSSEAEKPAEAKPVEVRVRVDATPPEAPQVVKTIERDEKGLIVRVVESPGVVVKTLQRDSEGKITQIVEEVKEP